MTRTGTQIESPLAGLWGRFYKGNAKYFNFFSYSFASSMVKQIPIPFIILPFLSRKLTQSKFGEFMIVLSMIHFVNVVLGSSISMAIYRRHQDISLENKPSFFGSVIKLSLLVSAVIAIMLVLLKGYLFKRWEIDFSSQWLLPLLAYTILMVVDAVLSAIISINLKFSFLTVCGCIYLIFLPVVVLCYLVIPNGLWTIGFLFAPAIAVALMFNRLLKWEKIDFHSKLNWNFIGRFVSISSMFLITSMVANLLVYGDRWLLAEYGIPKSSIAIYSVSVQACLLITVIFQEMANVIMPVISNIKRYQDITVSQARKILAATFLSVFFVAVLGSIGGFLYIRIFFGRVYWSQCRILFMIIFAGMLLYPLQIFSRALIIRFHSLWSNLLIYIIACVIFLFSVRLLVGAHGINAFAFGRQFTYIWISIASFVLAQRWLISKLNNKSA